MSDPRWEQEVVLLKRIHYETFWRGFWFGVVFQFVLDGAFLIWWVKK